MCKTRDLIITIKLKAFCNKELNLNLDHNPLDIAPFLPARRAGYSAPLQQHFMLGEKL
jgi:hypothetical protein